MGSSVSHESIVSSTRLRIAAMKRYVTTKKEKLLIPVAGELLKPAQVVALFQAGLDTQAAVAVAQAALKGAMTARDEAELHRSRADEAMKGWVLQMFGDGSAEAGEFGYAARKNPRMSVEDRLKAVLLNKATRVARGTMSKKQKASANPRVAGDDGVEVRVVA